jgi:hypothetical protein
MEYKEEASIPKDPPPGHQMEGGQRLSSQVKENLGKRYSYSHLDKVSNAFQLQD